MEQSEDLRRDRTALGFMCFLVTTAILSLAEILCVGAYFGTVLCLIYFTFLKDCLEIFIYATAKYIARIKWLYKILKLEEFLYVRIETDGLESNTLRNLQNSVSGLSNSCLVENSPDTEASFSRNSRTSDPLSFNSSQSRNSRTSNPLSFNSSQSRNSSQSDLENENRSSVIFQSPRSSRAVSETPISRKFSTLSTQIISSTDSYNIDETNFEDVDLSEDINEASAVVSKEESLSEQSPSKWNIIKIKFFDTFRQRNSLSSPASVKTKLGNIASKVTDVLPLKADDNEKLISNKNDSPEQFGCCTSLPRFFKVDYPLSSLTSYARF